VVSERDICSYIVDRGELEGDRVTEDSVRTCCEWTTVHKQSGGDCRMTKLSTWYFRSDSSRSVRETDRNSKMATEGHKHAEKKSPKLMSVEEMDKELADIKREMEELEMKMRQNKKPRWVYEWPIKPPKVKWPVRELMVKGQQRMLRRWLRYAKNRRSIEEEELVQVCEPETRESFNNLESELGSPEDLKHCQEGREEEILDCQVGNELSSAEDLTDCQEDSEGISHCKRGND
jgi:hypothetical protein